MAALRSLHAFRTTGLDCPCRSFQEPFPGFARANVPRTGGAALWTNGSTGNRRRESMAVSALPSEISTAVAAVAGGGALSFLLVRAIVYFRMQYIVAAMLGRHVPRGGARVVDLNIGPGRNLYYLPKDVIQVIAIDPKGSQQLLQNQAIQAGIPVEVRTRDFESTQFPSESFDAVISVYGITEKRGKKISSVLKEAARVLKPGKPLIFVESTESENPLLLPLQTIWWEALRILGRGERYRGNLVEAIKATPGFKNIEFDRILEFQDPHVVGVAIKEEVKRGRKVGIGGEGGVSSKGVEGRVSSGFGGSSSNKEGNQKRRAR